MIYDNGNYIYIYVYTHAHSQTQIEAAVLLHIGLYVGWLDSYLIVELVKIMEKLWKFVSLYTTSTELCGFH